MNLIGVVGTRTHSKSEFEMVYQKVLQLTEKHNNSDVVWVAGGCPSGADKAIKDICWKHRYRYLEAVAFWTRPQLRGAAEQDKGAGYFRNCTISLVVSQAFAVWDGQSHGTKAFIRDMTWRGKLVTVIPWKVIEHPVDSIRGGK